ncbi:MAG: UDP-N-acetylmuramate dehydrogenase, partial [Candidatus Omnitrophota bacterium]
EMMTGIPGTVGGAIAVNAGSHDRSIGGQVEELLFLNASDEVIRLRRAEISFEYRTAHLPEGFILGAKLRVAPMDPAQVDEQCRQYLLHKKKTQDYSKPSAGCIFKNPKAMGKSSGELIELSGLKGQRVGDAQVSEKHANFIVNLGCATSEDVFALIEKIQKKVKKDHGCALELEVRVL